MSADDEDLDRPAAPQENKKVVAGILAILLGGLGVHKFYLGMTKAGIIQILANVACFAGSLIALVEGIIYLTKSDADFFKTYQIDKKQWF